MKKRWMILVLLGMFGGMGLDLAFAQQSQKGAGIDSFIEVLRSDMRTQHMAQITSVMQFSDVEGKVFWPIFRDYERDLMKLNDEKIQIIKDYAESYENMTDEKAHELAERSLDFQAGRVKLMRNYYKKFSKALSPKTAAKFLQLENQLLLLMDLQIASEMPLVK